MHAHMCISVETVGEIIHNLGDCLSYDVDKSRQEKITARTHLTYMVVSE